MVRTGIQSSTCFSPAIGGGIATEQSASQALMISNSEQ